MQAFAALAQPTRLAIVKLLVRAGPNGMASGDIARAVAAPTSTVSTHLAVLARAGLVSGRRDSRLIFYSADLTGLAGLLGYLVDDCCEGRPEICAPLAASVGRAASCAPANTTSSPRKRATARSGRK